LVRAAGIDPGTGTFDLVVVEGGRVLHASSYPAEYVSSGGHAELVREVESYQPDVVIGPSGYGTPVVCSEEIANPRLFAERVLLLSGYHPEGSREFSARGGEVYVGVLRLVEELWKSSLNACYMPGVIHLRTVAPFKKLNRIDMGTVDKLAAAFYVAWALSKTEELSDINVIVAELGYGYNAALSLESARIVDGHGGTVVSNSLLSIGGLDAEIPSMLGRWSRALNYAGGVLSMCGASGIDEALSRGGECETALDSMVYSLVKTIYALKMGSDKRVFLTGRLSRVRKVVEKISAYGIRPEVVEGEASVKEAAVGYALLGEGLMGGASAGLFSHMGIAEACGGTVDWVRHPEFAAVRRAFHEAVRESVKRASWYKFSCD